MMKKNQKNNSDTFIQNIEIHKTLVFIMSKFPLLQNKWSLAVLIVIAEQSCLWKDNVNNTPTHEWTYITFNRFYRLLGIETATASNRSIITKVIKELLELGLIEKRKSKKHLEYRVKIT